MMLPSLFLTVDAQITMGSLAPPASGSLLDLKENKDGTATKGLLLPRVSLTNKNELYPMFENGYDIDEKSKHTGLLVYNVNNDACVNIHSGAHIWDGTSWVALEENSQVKHVDLLVDVRGDEKNTYYIGHFNSGNTDAGWWMLENLRTTKWADGSTTGIKYISDPTADTNESEMFAAFIPALIDESLISQYGYFYNYNAATNYAPEEESGPIVQGICPNGWHIPTSDDWKLLLQAIKENPCPYSTSDIGANGGANLQASGLTPLGTSRPKEEGGFNAVLQGMVTHLGIFQYKDTYGNYWASYPSKFPSGTTYLGVATFLNNNAQSLGFLNISTLNGIAHYVPVRCTKNK